MTNRTNRPRISCVLHLAWKNFIIRDIAFHFRNDFPTESLHALLNAHRHSHSHSIVTCHLFNYCWNFKNKIDHTHTHTHVHVHTHCCCCVHSWNSRLLSQIPSLHTDINSSEASHYQRACCTGIVSLLLKLIRGHFPWYSLTLWNKSTKALVFANAQSCEASRIFAAAISQKNFRFLVLLSFTVRIVNEPVRSSNILAHICIVKLTS